MTRSDLTDYARGAAASGVSIGKSGKNTIDGVLSGSKWSGHSLHYAFPDQSSDYSYSGEKNQGFGVADKNIQLAARYTLDQSYGGKANDGFSVEGFTKLKISEGSDTNSEIRYADSTAANPTAFAYYPDRTSRGGDVWFGNQFDYGDAKAGNYSFVTVIHETGHALGLKHPHETEGSFGKLARAYDAVEYTVMSYRSYAGASMADGYLNEEWDYPQSYMMVDIAALQHLYGADYTTNSGNTVYKWTPGSGVTYVNGDVAIKPGANKIFATIWDGGGTDTYDLRAYSNDLYIDLRPGEESRFSTRQRAELDYDHASKIAKGNIYNAFLHKGDERSLIENARGGSGDDIIIGNQGVNHLWGNKGADTLKGGSDNDIMSGGAGADVFVFQKGWDRDRIDDFSGADRIDVSSFDFKSFSALKSLFQQMKSSVVIDFGSGDALVVADAKIADLDRDVFVL
jgi:serralysin